MMDGLTPKERDRIKAKQRMRQLRAKHGGTTPNDRARNKATQALISAHREEFDGWYRDFLALEWEEE